jgi:hypothetical protein
VKSKEIFLKKIKLILLLNKKLLNLKMFLKKIKSVKSMEIFVSHKTMSAQYFESNF